MQVKKIFCLVLICSLCSCAVEPNDNDMEPVVGKVIFNALVDDEDQTRASVGEKDSDGNYPMIWNEGDSISVVGIHAKPWNDCLGLYKGAGTKEASFAGDCTLDTDGYYVVYPYNENTKPDHSDAHDPYMPDIWWDGSHQTAHAGSFDPEKGVMLAYSESTQSPVSVSFTHLCSYIKFTTNYKCKKIVFEALDSAKIACRDFAVNMSSGKAPKIAWANSQTASITMTGVDGGDIPAGTYYIATLPTELSEGFRITFHSSNVGWMYYYNDTDKSVNLQRGHILNLGEFDLASNLVEFAGSGTSSDPYIVSDIEELKLVPKRVNNGKSNYASAYYSLTSDIDATGIALTPIGGPAHPFQGHWSGNRHKIINPLYDYVKNGDGGIIVKDYYYNYGFFGDIKDAEISDIVVENPQMNDNGEGNPSKVRCEVGLIAAHVFGTSNSRSHISRCKVTGAFRLYFNTLYCGGAYHVGGIVGACNGNILVDDCESDVVFENMPLNDHVNPGLGGIMGYAGPIKSDTESSSHSGNALVIIERCRNNGDLGYYLNEDSGNNSEAAVGGILGKTYDSTIENVCIKIGNCVNTGKVYVHGQYVGNIYTTYVGGIVGNNDSDGYVGQDPEIFNCLNTGWIESNGRCFWDTIPDRVSWSGSIVGRTYDGDTAIHMCVHIGHFSFDVADGKYHSTFCGKNGTITNCFTYGDDYSPENLNKVLSTETYHYGSKVKWYTNKRGDLDLYMSF